MSLLSAASVALYQSQKENSETVMSAVVHLRKENSVLVIEIDNPPVNASSQAVRTQLLSALKVAVEDVTTHAVVLSAAGKTFVAGADITEFDQAVLPLPDPNELHQAIEDSPKPVVAALQGNVLGAGLELALSCHFRVASESCRIGLPEVKLGVLPGSGGTQRLPRLVDIKAALDLMVTGKSIDASHALELGVLDYVVAGNLTEEALKIAADAITSPESLRITSRLPVKATDLPAAFFSEYRKRLAPKNAGGRASHAIVTCVEESLSMSFDVALQRERAAFLECRDSAESIALRHLFFAERQAAKPAGISLTAALLPVKKIGVVGAGTMGTGIAMAFANSDFPVTLIDISPDSLRRGLEAIRRSYESSVAKGKLTKAQAEQKAALIGEGTNLARLSDCDLIVEAAFENMEVKRSICRELGDLCKPDAIIATNTSSLDVNQLAEVSRRPAKFVGMHFFSPANIMKLLEVVRGSGTSDQTLATVLALGKKIGKTPVVSGVCWGFIGNRMLEGYLREAEFLLMEGASALQIDRALEAMGMAMGPCRMIDLAGVDVAAKVVLERHKAGGLSADPSYRAVVRALFEQGRMGQKSAHGFYRYDGRVAIPDQSLSELCIELASLHHIPRRAAISNEEIVERCLLPLMNEGARILEEGIAYRDGDVDVVWVNGYGFPAWKGGPMHMAESMGGSVVAARIANYATTRGNPHGYWTPSVRFEFDRRLSA